MIPQQLLLSYAGFSGIISLTSISSLSSGYNDLQDVSLSKDGTKMILTNYSSGGSAGCARYNLGTPYDLSTAIYQGFTTMSVGQICGRFHQSKGHVVISSWINTYIGVWPMSTPDDVTTLGTLNYLGVANNNTFGAMLSLDGTKYYHGNNSGSYFQRNLSTPFNAGSAGSIVHTLTIPSTHFGMFLCNEGKYLWTLDNGGSTVREYILSTAWDLATATHTRDITVSGLGSNCYGLHVSPDYRFMYISRYGSGANVYQYRIN